MYEVGSSAIFLLSDFAFNERRSNVSKMHTDYDACRKWKANDYDTDKVEGINSR
jgi:hypothetical protein